MFRTQRVVRRTGAHFANVPASPSTKWSHRHRIRRTTGSVRCRYLDDGDGCTTLALPRLRRNACPAGSSLQVPSGGTHNSNNQAQCVITSTGTPVGGVKHVWLIILENKSYDETFTGLNQNSYLWQTLPQQGALLTNYYGTGHFSMDNYISLVSGQSPSYGVQDDCSTTANMTNTNSGIITNGTVGTATDTDHTTDGSGTNTNTPNATASNNGNYGQLLVHGGVDAALGNNGCVYPTDVATLFNQYNAAGVSWKAYAQDLGGAQPVGSTTLRHGHDPRRQRHRARA